MAYAYAKNQKELKEKLSKKGFVVKTIGKTNPRYNLGDEKNEILSCHKGQSI